MTARTKRRGNGEGSIYQRSDGRWCGCINIGYNGAGKRQRKVVYGATKKEVQDGLTKLQGKKLGGVLVKVERQTVAEFLTWWLESVAKGRIRATTYANYETMIRVHVNPRLGGLALAKLLPDHLINLQTSMADAGASPRVRQLTYAILHRALGDAMRLGKVARNVCDVVDRPRVEKSTVRALDPGQVDDFLVAAETDRLYALYVLAIASGLRLGELCGLQWSDVDLDAGTVTVRHTLMEVKGRSELSQPKSESGRRRVDLAAAAVAALVEHRKQLMREGLAGCPFVFCDTDGNTLRRSNITRRSFKPTLKRAGLPDMRFHDLRHTSASLLLTKGVHPKVVQERLGHSQISLTLDTYSHVMPSLQRDAANSLDGFLVRKKATTA
ncbi:MAG: tyrosine-type recombinase/integrase [Planctomycetia bacterium]|nr:tyrosine-type recombinase/integrase [Planctomycetia bacterium]